MRMCVYLLCCGRGCVRGVCVFALHLLTAYVGVGMNMTRVALSKVFSLRGFSLTLPPIVMLGGDALHSG